MKLKFQNIGIIEEAEIEIKSITVITGVNNSGKSTFGKLLYAISMVQNMVSNDEMSLLKYISILNELNGITRWMNNEEYDDLLSEYKYIIRILERRNPLEWINQESDFNYNDRIEKLDEIVESMREIVEDYQQTTESYQDKLTIALKNLTDRLSKNENDEHLSLMLLKEMLEVEFSDSFLSEFPDIENALIQLVEDNGDEVQFKYKKSGLDFENSSFKIHRKYSLPIYFDDPFLLDDSEHGLIFRGPKHNLFKYKHNHNLKRQILRSRSRSNVFDEDIQNKKIEEIFSGILEGEIIKENRGFAYNNPNFRNPISLDSLSAGMKSFSTIKILMENGLLNNVEYLILDEPETHLHPRWQVKFAELIVLISKIYPLRILVTSHSPYFIEALELYSKKYEIEGGVKFYNAKSDSNLAANKFENITGNLETVYKEMYKPLNFLEELRDDLYE